jgi:uncharacterized protein
VVEMMTAVLDNDLPAASDCIARGVDVNRRGSAPYTPLMAAAALGNVQMVEKLLLAGADVHVIDPVMGLSPLHLAAQSGVVDVARLLLDNSAFIDLQSPTTGMTPLICAVWAKRAPMVGYLLARGATPEVQTKLGGATVADFVAVGIQWTAGFTNPSEENWGRNIAGQLEANRLRRADIVATQPLMAAVQAGDLAQARSLITSGADLDAKSPVLANGNDGQTPLLVACFLGHAEIVAALLEAGANPRIVDYLLGATPAHKAAYAGRPEALVALKRHGGVEINAQGPFNGFTAMHDAVWHGHKEALEVILDWPNVRFDLRSLDGRTPLKLATDLGYSKLAALIMAATARIEKAESERLSDELVATSP